MSFTDVKYFYQGNSILAFDFYSILRPWELEPKCKLLILELIEICCRERTRIKWFIFNCVDVSVLIFLLWRWKVKVKAKSLSRVWLCATPWTVAYQAPLSMGFSRQEDWSGLPFPSAGDHPKSLKVGNSNQEDRESETFYVLNLHLVSGVQYRNIIPIV